MTKIFIFCVALFCAWSCNAFGQRKQTFKEIGIQFESSVIVVKNSDIPATSRSPKTSTYEGLAGNGKPYLSVFLKVEEYSLNTPASHITDLIQKTLSPTKDMIQKNGMTFYLDSQKSGLNDTAYYLQFAIKNKRYTITIDGKSGTKAELDKIFKSLVVLK